MAAVAHGGRDRIAADSEHDSQPPAQLVGFGAGIGRWRGKLGARLAPRAVLVMDGDPLAARTRLLAAGFSDVSVLPATAAPAADQRAAA